MASSSKPADLHIANARRLASDDLSAANMLFAQGNRYGAYHLQQCAEKILLALLTAEDLQIERRDSHRLDVLRDKLPDINPFKERFRPLAQLTVFATTYRYPKDGGRIPKMPGAAETKGWADRLRVVLTDAATHFGVNLSGPDSEPALTVAPPRSTGP